MTSEEMTHLMETIWLELRDISSRKGIEYANSEDRLANFKRLADRLGSTPEKVLMVYFTKHLDSIEFYAKTGKVMSEPVEGRINDAILYLCLLRGLIMERQLGRVQ